MSKNDTLQRIYRPADTGFNLTAINAGDVDGTYVGIKGMNQATLLLSYVYGAGTNVTFTVSYKVDDGNLGIGSTEYILQHLEDGGSGTINTYDRTFTVTGTASWVKAFHVPINGDYLAITGVTAAGSPTTSDTLTATIITAAL